MEKALTEEGYSDKARKSAALARKIRNRLGEAAYLNYKNHGIVPAGLDQAQPLPKPPHVKHEPLQADIRPDTAPVKSPQATTDEFLHSLRQGSIVRTGEGQRLRIQKVHNDGLRVHDPKGGARDLNWEQLKALQLKPEEKPEEGARVPAARRLGELRAEAEALGIAVPPGMSTRDIERLIGEHLAKTHEGNILAQVDPQLASDDAKKLQDFSADQPWRSPAMGREFWDNDKWIAEEKLDGVRLKLHFTSDGVRADSRRRDTKTRRFSEKSQNFPHLLALDVPDLHGTVLDAEGMIPATSGVLPSGEKFKGALPVSTAATNAGREMSMEIQNKFGPMQFWLFDILRYKGDDVSQRPWSERRDLLEKVHAQLIEDVPPTQGFMHTTHYEKGDAKLPFFEDILSKGGEGVIFKEVNHKYQEGKRSKFWQKLKRFQEVDTYVTGYIPGKAGNEGLVGALEVSVPFNGKDHHIASVSQLTGEQRLAMTAPDGSLKPEYYGRVLTIRGQELTGKSARFRHAVLVGFREDKAKSDIDGYEVNDELQELLGVPAKKSAQETFI